MKKEESGRSGRPDKLRLHCLLFWVTGNILCVLLIKSRDKSVYLNILCNSSTLVFIITKLNLGVFLSIQLKSKNHNLRYLIYLSLLSNIDVLKNSYLL